MRIKNMTVSLLTLLLAAGIPHSAMADSDASVKHYTIKQSAPMVGTNLKKDIVKAGTIPLNKPYDELTAEQQQTLRDAYDNMPKTDEPPFPEKGLYPIYKAIASAHENLSLAYKGALNINVLVDSEGNPQSVEVMDTPNEDISKAAVAAAMRQKYKAAVCGGQHCTMKLPVHADLIGPDETNLSGFNTPGLNGRIQSPGQKN
ncbi:hypothetical protein AAKU67_002424 [Oxalobacteraceae bacterium GrIS 2.11]